MSDRTTRVTWMDGEFDDGVGLRLTRAQRNFVSKKVLKSLAKARDNRDRIEAKYAEPARHQENVIASLIGLGIKLGLTDEELDITPQPRKA